MRRRRLAHWSPIFGVNEQQCLRDCTRESEAIESLSQNFFRIGWTITEKSQAEHEPKFTRLYDLLPIRSSSWRNFRWNYRGLRFGKVWSRYTSNSFRDIQQKIISWWRRRTSTTALSEKAFAFRLSNKTKEATVQIYRDRCICSHKRIWGWKNRPLAGTLLV